MTEQTKPPLSVLLDNNFNDMVRKLASAKAAKFTNNPLITAGDLESEGMLATLRAYERFDPSRGAKFRTYAYVYVVRAMEYYCLHNRFKLSASSKDLRNAFTSVHEANSGFMSIDEIDVPHDPASQLDVDLEEFLLAGLTSRQKALVRDRFINEMSIKDLANKYQLSTSGIAEALSRLRPTLRKRGRRYESCDSETV